MKRGDIGDRMFVSIKGSLGVYIADYHPGLLPDALIKEYKVVGERSLEMKNDTRNATIVAMEKKGALCLSLDRDSYSQLIKNKNIADKEKRFKFLTTFCTEVFKEYNPIKIREINDEFML